MLYIALLRGINVGGHQVKMERLRELFAELGLLNVRSYIQSGNVFFETEEADRELLTTDIERHLRQVLGYEVPTCLRTADELDDILAAAPFPAMTITEEMRCCITFTTQPILSDLALPMRTARGDMELVKAREYEAYVVWHLINGRPPGASSNFDKLLGKGATTRFFHTTRKILDAARGE